MQNSLACSLKKYVVFFAAFILVTLAEAASARTVFRSSQPIAAFFTSTGALTCKPNGLWFGKVELGTSKSLSGALINTGNTVITISSMNQSSRFFSVSGISLPLAIPPGVRLPFTVNFTPESLGRVDDSLGFVSDASGSVLYLTVHGVGYLPGTLSPSPTTITFGTVTLGQTSTQTLVLTNTGHSSLTISQISAVGGFSPAAVALPLTLWAGQSAQVPVTFTAKLPGTSTGSVTLISNASDPSLVIPVSANVPSPGTLQPVYSSLSFGTVDVGATASRMETLTNSGGTSVTVLQATISGSGFSLTGLPTPLTLTPGQNYTFPITFTPSGGGNIAGNLTINSDASNSSLTIPLAGSGVSAGQLSLLPASLDFATLRWDKPRVSALR